MNAKPTKRVQYFGHHDLPQNNRTHCKARPARRITVAYKLIAIAVIVLLAGALKR